MRTRPEVSLPGGQRRPRARRAGYPVWFWLATGIGMAAVPLYVVRTWLPSPWDPVISLSLLVLLAATAIGAALRAQRGAVAFAVWTGLGLAATTFSALLPARR